MPPKKTIKKSSKSDSKDVPPKVSKNEPKTKPVIIPEIDTTSDSNPETDLSVVTEINSVEAKHEEVDEHIENQNPFFFEVPNVSDSIFDVVGDVTFSGNIDYPKSYLGFHHFIHQSKNNMGTVMEPFAGKKQVWRILNRYETSIENYNESISDISIKYFDIKKEEPNILSRAFYKLWEIIMSFDLIDLDKDKFTSASLAEGPGGFLQSIIMYRDKFSSKSKNDKYYAITLHPEGKSYVPELDKKFIEHYNKETPKRVYIHKTHSKQVAGSNKNYDNGDLTDPKTMRLFGGEIEGKCDLITADGGFENINENLQEQESFRLIISEIINAAKIQKKGGNFVCKFFESFTLTTAKIMAILKELYNDVYFMKPLTSRISNSEKYVICMKFKYNDTDKQYIKIMSVLETIMIDMHNNKSDFVTDIFSEWILPFNLKKFIIGMNTTLSNIQFKNVGMITSYIKKNIFLGDEYYEKRNEQIEGNAYWIDIYYPNDKTFNNTKKEREGIMSTSINKSNKNITLLTKNIIDTIF